MICAYGALIKEPLLSAHELLNVHPSLLPRWRGAAPIERAIEAGDEETGRDDHAADRGARRRARSACSAPSRSRPTTTTAAWRRGWPRSAASCWSRRSTPQPPFREQPEQGVTYAEKIEPADRLLDPARPADELERRVRALTPHVGAYVELDDGERLGVRRAALAAGVDDVPPGALDGARSRVAATGRRPGALELLEVQPPGKRPMDAAAWLRGRRAEPD